MVSNEVLAAKMILFFEGELKAFAKKTLSNGASAKDWHRAGQLQKIKRDTEKSAKR